jgi:PhzF family phenazine biosynthesis protein
MRVPFFQLDAFAGRCFAGNPAAVMLLGSWPEDSLLQRIAAENNLSETAFLVGEGEGWRIRWFTPRVEVPLCGHATLAAAAVVMERLEPGRERVDFASASGTLRVLRAGRSYRMDLPARRPEPIACPAGLEAAIGEDALETLFDGSNLIVRLVDAAAVRRLAPDPAAVARLPAAGLAATAAGEGAHDCVSRYFAPAKGIDEDPVTGGAHCGLAPYWAARLGRSEIRAFQASARGGELICRVRGERVEIDGACTFYLQGHATW